MARTRRVKLKGTAWYHLITRVTNQDFLLESAEVKTRFLDFLRRTLDFSGVELGTYAIMDNHIHLFVRVLEARELDDAEILRRISVLNGKERADKVQRSWDRWQKTGRKAIYEADRARFVRRMYDLSAFMKTLKELFTMWYNRTYQHVGTLWTDRFKSLLVEDGDHATRLRVYIEKNPVRAGIVQDAADYAWNGVGASRRGDLLAQHGQELLDSEQEKGDRPPVDAGQEVTGKECGDRPPVDTGVGVPGRRVVAFSNGKVLGSHAFVTKVVREMGFFSRRTHAWPLEEEEFKNKVFAALGYKQDAIERIDAA